MKDRLKVPNQTRANGDQTREKIINAAERLFGSLSFDTVSLRDITNEAGVTLALASYHFGTKENLFSAIITRRADILNCTRRERLNALDISGTMSVEAVLDAFIHPLFEQMKSDDEGWKAYLMLLTKLSMHDRWLHYLHENFDETANLFIAQLKIILPDAPDEHLTRGFSFVLMLMLQTVSQNRRLDTLSNNRYSSTDLDASYSSLLMFSLAGLTALTTSN
ncbi:TetR/AcrR family transcriptional regulator [Rhizobium sp.]|jgi:AcrR family transcriptional regulator|uniref:TetR/AcrR family transcriptional regulator n=1 Tax=Rhizobium sp. TaxID=391 RepID=UPI000E9A9F38|nr:TetR/AcrR family transcriptional regulator [Rhizobium sp.]